jgi:hypothetical protein
MSGSDDETLLEQPAQEQPAHWADARLARVVIAVAIVLGSAGVGYLASRIWPLTGFSGSKLQVASASKPKVFESRMFLPAAAVQEAKFAEPSALAASRPPEQPQPPASANWADKLKNELPDSTQVPVDGSFVVLNAGTAEQSTDDKKSASKTQTRVSKNELAEAARRETANKKKPSRVAQGQKNPEAGPKNAKSAAAGASLHDPALREFMTTTPMRH